MAVVDILLPFIVVPISLLCYREFYRLKYETDAFEKVVENRFAVQELQNTVRRLEEELQRRDGLHDQMTNMKKDLDALKQNVGHDGLHNQMTNMKKDLDALKQNVGQNISEIYHGTGSTFTRWGRPDCPDTNSSLVYSGYVGGSHWTNTGAAINYLCLTKEPIWNEHVATRHPTYLYGTEYEFYDQTTFGAGLVNKEPPCAVCLSPRSTVIMIPGRNVCYGGWTTEYSGYLVAGFHDHSAATEFICLDVNAILADRSDSADNNGKLMYMVRTQCGSLQCPPYKNDWTVTCVVCSK